MTTYLPSWRLSQNVPQRLGGMDPLVQRYSGERKAAVLKKFLTPSSGAYLQELAGDQQQTRTGAMDRIPANE